MNMKSCIYQGTLYHQRYLPKVNKFTYTVFFMFLDLDELEQIFANRWLWSVGRANLANFKRSDYLGSAEISLDQAVRNRVEKEFGERPDGPIRMLTHLRYFGHCFNPVTFYYCYNKADNDVLFIVAEITNTPWRERHSYVLRNNHSRDDAEEKRFQFKKEFHVSPFMDMDFHYDWHFRNQGSSLFIQMVNYKEQTKYFEATLKMRRKEISGPSLAWVLLRFPAMTIKVLSMIYWQAFRLWLKKTPYYEHPKYLQEKKS
jgi:DUF1365 family protein